MLDITLIQLRIFVRLICLVANFTHRATLVLRLKIFSSSIIANVTTAIHCLILKKNWEAVSNLPRDEVLTAIMSLQINYVSVFSAPFK